VKKYNVAVVGATGAVGQEILKILNERNFPINNLKLLASERSHGKKMLYQGKEYMVEATVPDSFEGSQIVLFAGGSVSKVFAPEAVKRGAIVIDNSSSFRMDPQVPLIVPEVNPEDIKWHQGIIANPNCSTIQMVVALKPLHDAAKIKRIVVSTYQAVSGAGKEAIDELELQVKQSVLGEKIQPQVFPYQIAFNLIPHIDVFLEDNYTKEEIKMVNETQKMFHDKSIAICATTVRVPVYRSHSEVINIETEKTLSPEETREILKNAPGVVVIDDPASKQYPMPLYAADTDEVYVGRIRKDISCPNGLVLWVVADQIRKGAATNAVQIAELLIKENLI
jgi:aspartate-semialdehyde dehydrogenase